jgi:hypothetical protein
LLDLLQEDCLEKGKPCLFFPIRLPPLLKGGSNAQVALPFCQDLAIIPVDNPQSKIGRAPITTDK